MECTSTLIGREKTYTRNRERRLRFTPAASEQVISYFLSGDAAAKLSHINGRPVGEYPTKDSNIVVPSVDDEIRLTFSREYFNSCEKRSYVSQKCGSRPVRSFLDWIFNRVVTEWKVESPAVTATFIYTPMSSRSAVLKSLRLL